MNGLGKTNKISMQISGGEESSLKKLPPTRSFIDQLSSSQSGMKNWKAANPLEQLSYPLIALGKLLRDIFFDLESEMQSQSVAKESSAYVSFAQSPPPSPAIERRDSPQARSDPY